MKNIFLLFMILSALSTYSQEKSIFGEIRSAEGEPLPGASIIVKGTSTGTVTDFDGKFELQVKTGDILLVSYVGYKSDEKTVDSTNEYNFVLEESVAELEAVVITGYSKEKKSDIAGAITVVDVGDLAQESNPNILTTMQGRVPGIQINSGGTPGGNDSQITIRGLTTVNSGSSPLWVIDGVQTFNPAALNPDEIESIQVLKDGASTALYGTSAANGVIVVTTKKGKIGVSEFSLKTETTINFLRDKVNTLNAKEWTDVYYQARANDGISGNFNVLVDNGTGFDIPEYLDDAQLLKSSDTDWVDVITDESVSYNTDFNYRYGNEDMQIYTGINYAKDNGIQKYTNYERYNARLNSSFNLLNDKITIGENFLYSNFSEVKANEYENAILQNPLIPVYTEIGTYSVATIQDKPNALANLWANRKNEQRTQRFLGNVYLNYEIISGLEFNTKLNFDISKYRFDTRTQPFVQMTEMPSVFQNIDADSVDNESLRTIWTNLLTYTKEIDKHRFSLLAGLEFTRQDDDYITERIRGVDITQYPEYIIRSDAEFQTITNKIDYRKESQFGSAKYIYDDRYIISGSIRRDGSSRFGPNNRYGIFPAASVAWNVSNEDFLQNSEVVSNLKFRGSWGVNGNDIIGDYLFLNAYIDNTVGNVIEFSDYDIDGDGQGALEGILQARQANPDIKWEETTQYNVGFDLGLFRNSVSLTVDLFDKRTDNLILQPISQAITGESAPPTINAGEVSNKGFEFVLSYDNISEQDFKFGVDLNFSKYVNNVESLDSDNNFLLNNSIAITRPGDPIASFYGLVADGLFRTPEEVAVHAQQPGKGLGRIRYRDVNSDGIINNEDRTIIGNPHPDFIYGINLKFAYKNFNISAYFDGKQGNDIYNTQRNLGDFTYFSYNFLDSTLDSWAPNNANSNIPALSTINSNNETQPSSYFVEDGSYFRLKTITIGYTFQIDTTKAIGLDNLNLYLVGQNLLNFTSFSGFDYEVSGLSANGIGIAGYGIPHSKSITLGVSTKF